MYIKTSTSKNKVLLQWKNLKIISAYTESNDLISCIITKTSKVWWDSSLIFKKFRPHISFSRNNKPKINIHLNTLIKMYKIHFSNMDYWRYFKIWDVCAVEYNTEKIKCEYHCEWEAIWKSTTHYNQEPKWSWLIKQ